MMMKKPNYFLSIALLPFLLMVNLDFNQGKSGDKGQKKGNQKEHKQNNHPGNFNDKKFKGDGNNMKGNGVISKNNAKNWDVKNKNVKWKDDDRWDDKRWDDYRFDVRMDKLKKGKKGKWVNAVYYPGITWWVGNNYESYRLPKKQKKVRICHKPNGSNYPVNIEVSVNALPAHLNHGDYEGRCSDFDRGRFSNAYWDTRTSYYTQYMQTTETLSLGEQLLLLAIDKLTNSRNLLNAQRSSLSPQEINRREIVIINLQNDTYALERSLQRGNTRITQTNYVF